MKKLIFIFVALFAVVLISGCGASQNTIRYNNGTGSGEEAAVSEDIAEDSGEVAAEESESEEDRTDTAEKTSEPAGKLSVTSFDGGFLKSNLSYNVVKGTAPSDTAKITINDYHLQKYLAGRTQWDYIASTRFSTLKNGLNTYVVKTYNANGDQTDSLIFTIDYEAPIVPAALPGVGANHWLALLFSLILAGSYKLFRRYRWL